MTITAIDSTINLDFYGKETNMNSANKEALSFKTRHILTDKKLEELAAFASNIPEPKLYGTYRDNSHYVQTLKLMLNSTLETRHRGMFFLKKILPLLKQSENMLDVGPGDGQLTGWIGNKFKKITMVDSSKEILTALNRDKNIFHKHTVLEKIHASILNLTIPKNHYDLGLLSHILYYIDKSKWLDAVDIVYQSLKKGGILVIALSGDNLGKADLIKYFGGDAIDIDELSEECALIYGRDNMKMFTIDEQITVKYLNTMLHIAGFFLYDTNTVASREELSTYFAKFNQKSKHMFEMSSRQKFIVLTKE